MLPRAPADCTIGTPVNLVKRSVYDRRLQLSYISIWHLPWWDVGGLKEIMVPLKSAVTLAVLQWGQDIGICIGKGKSLASLKWFHLQKLSFMSYVERILNIISAYYCSVFCWGVNLTNLYDDKVSNTEEDQSSIFKKLKERKAFLQKVECLRGSVIQIVFLRQIEYSVRTKTFAAHICKELMQYRALHFLRFLLRQPRAPHPEPEFSLARLAVGKSRFCDNLQARCWAGCGERRVSGAGGGAPAALPAGSRWRCSTAVAPPRSRSAGAAPPFSLKQAGRGKTLS